VGHTQVFDDIVVSPNRYAMPYSMPEHGLIERISMWHAGGGTGGLRFGVYNGQDRPDHRIAQTARVSVSALVGWQTVDLASPVFVEEGTRIWLAWVYEDNPGLALRTGIPGRADSGMGWKEGMPEEFGASTVSRAQYSIYASYLPAGHSPDRRPPDPNPALWAMPPAALDHSSITMSALEATDPEGVEYFFEETSGNPGGSDSGWQESHTYTDDKLQAHTQYAYRVRTRDRSLIQNLGLWSSSESALTAEARLAHPIVITEFMTANDDVIVDPQGEYDDWIELHNSGSTPVDIGGMLLCDSGSRWHIPDDRSEETVIGPFGHLLVWADEDLEDTPGLHADFKLDKTGDEIMLYHRDGVTLIDGVRFDGQTTDTARARYPDALGPWYDASEPTPGAQNRPGRGGTPSFSRPAGMFTDPFLLALTTESPTASIYYSTNGDEPNETSTPYTDPLFIAHTTWIRARVYDADLSPGPIVSQAYIRLDADLEEFSSNMPIAIIDSFGRNIDAEADGARPHRPILMAFVDVNQVTGRAALTGPVDFAGYGGVHVRGSSSARYAKKQYKFETWDEADQDRAVSLLGLPAESDWILQGPYSDKTLMRNVLMYTWNRRLGRYGVRCRFIEAFVDMDGDGQVTWDRGYGHGTDYRGVYILMEKIKRDVNRINVSRLDRIHDSEPEITGGYIFKKDWERDFETDIYGDDLAYVYPAREDITPVQKDWLRNYLNQFEVALSSRAFTDPQEGYAKFIDIDSWIDHHILVEIARNVDGYVLSTYLFKDRGGKLHMGPIWDYNGSLGGADYFCTYRTEGWHYEFDERQCGGGGERFPADNQQGYHWYQRIFADPEFLKQYADRWFELRKGVLSTANMLADIDSNVQLLTDHGNTDSPVKRNFRRWPVLSQHVWPNYKVLGSYAAEIDWLKTWLVARLEWMDSAIADQYSRR